MTPAQVVRLAIVASIVLIVLGLGLKASWRDATWLFREPRMLLRSLVSMYLVMPLLAGVIIATFDLRPAIAVALIALAVAPVPPISPRRELKLVSEDGYVFGLLSAASILSVVLAPLCVWVLAVAFSRHVPTSAPSIARIVAVTCLIPLMLGMTIHHLAPALAAKLRPIVSVAGEAVLIVAVVAILATAWRPLLSLLGDGTLLVFLGFMLCGLAVGHVLGGPQPENRTVLALSTACRHPGVAISIAGIGFPNQKLASAAIALYLLVAVLGSVPYTIWRRHQRARVSTLADSESRPT
jgi:bile acid:Na+ symporter, BASS family